MAPLVFAIAATAAIVTVVANEYMGRAVAEVARERGRSIAASTRHAISRAMRSGRSGDLQSLLEQAASQPDVYAARILTSDGTVRRSSYAPEVGSVLPAHAIRPDGPSGRMMVSRAGDSPVPVEHTVSTLPLVDECRGCHKGGPSVALLDLDISLRRQVAGLGVWRGMGASLAGVQIALLIALTFPILALLVVAPVRRLVAAMGRVQAGDLSVRLPRAAIAEIDALVGGFNAMVARLKDAAQRDEERRLEQMHRAERLATVGELAAGLAHEIRNPLASVKAAVEVLRDDPPADTMRRAILSECVSELARIEQVTRDLLGYARPRAPSITIADINRIASDAVQLARAEAVRHHVDIETEFDPQLPVVPADESMIRQVLVNLILNALQAVDGNASAGVRVVTGRENGSVVCRVRDNGPGVPAALGDSLFRPFFTTKSSGTGLGLAISRRLVEMHGGQLRLENPGERGASFAFDLPLGGHREANA